MTWLAIGLTAVGCYALKWIGLAMSADRLEVPWIQRVTGLLPIALLAALVAVQAFGAGRGLALDARAAGLAAGAVAVLLRAPFLVVVLVAALTAALIRVSF
jgi:branched-subunit amino acid transport protein